MEWQPIDTAPKDGREILVLNLFENISVAKWRPEVDEKSTSGNYGNYWQGVCCGWEAWCGGEELNLELDKLTFWMPLPELPQ
ncbi:hypothetical protein [Pedobacter sp.]|uniref:hypothetical protein n=1 Tax=Pedobacter sp. TaxID=1411316 RepID=UPI003C66C014